MAPADAHSVGGAAGACDSAAAAAALTAPEAPAGADVGPAAPPEAAPPDAALAALEALERSLADAPPAALEDAHPAAPEAPLAGASSPALEAAPADTPPAAPEVAHGDPPADPEAALADALSNVRAEEFLAAALEPAPADTRPAALEVEEARGDLPADPEVADALSNARAEEFLAAALKPAPADTRPAALEVARGGVEPADPEAAPVDALPNAPVYALSAAVRIGGVSHREAPRVRFEADDNFPRAQNGAGGEHLSRDGAEMPDASGNVGGAAVVSEPGIASASDFSAAFVGQTGESSRTAVECVGEVPRSVLDTPSVAEAGNPVPRVGDCVAPASSADAAIFSEIICNGGGPSSLEPPGCNTAPANDSTYASEAALRAAEVSDIPKDVETTIGRVAVHLYAPDALPGATASPRSPAGNQALAAAFCKQLGLPALGTRPASRALGWLATIARRDRSLRWSAVPAGLGEEDYVISLAVWAGVWDGDEVVRGSDTSRQVMWHLKRHGEGVTGSGAEEISSCGFVGCNDVCMKGTTDKAQFRLDRLFGRCAIPTVPDAGNWSEALDGLLALPDEALENIAVQLDPKNLMALGSTCRFLRKSTLGYVGGLNLRLYAHQEAAIWCMMARERGGKEKIGSPLYAELPVVESDSRFYVSLDDGTVRKGGIERSVVDCRGGLYCDEPGLGKTVTALALILKTLGQQARPPPDYDGAIEEEEDWDEEDDAGGLDLPTLRFCETEDYDMDMSIGRARDIRERVLLRRKKKERLRQSRRGLRKLYYCPRRADRYQAFGMDELAANGGRRGSGTDRRAIRRPDFLEMSKGEGSLPSVGLHDVPIYLSGASLCLVPDALVKHWEGQILQHVDRGALRVLTIKREDEVPSAVDLAFQYDVVIVNFTTINAVAKRMRSDAPPLLCVRFLRVFFDEAHKLGSLSKLGNFPLVSKLLRAERRWILTGTPAASVLSTDVRTLLPLLRFIRDEAFGLDEHAWTRVIQKPYEMHQPDALCVLEGLLNRVVIRSAKENVSIIPECIVKDVYLNFSEEAAECYNDLVLVGLRNLLLTDWYRDTHKESLLNPKNSKECIGLLENLRSSCCFGGVIRLEFDAVDVGESLELLHEYALTRRYGILKDVREEDKYLHVPPKSNWFSHSFYATSKKAKSLTEIESTGGALVTPKLVDNRDDMDCGANSEEIPEIDEFKFDDEEPLCLPRKRTATVSESRIEFRGVMKQIGKRLLDGCKCDTCGIFCRLPMLTTCGHTVCLPCYSTSKSGCSVPSCDHEFDLDSKGVARDVQELQPSVHSEAWKPNWESSVSAKMEYLLKRLDEIPERSVLVDGRWTMKRPKVIVYTQFHLHRLLLSLTFKKSEKYRNSYVELFVNEREIDKDHLGGSRLRKQTAADRIGRLLDDFEFNDDKQILLIETVHSSVGLDLNFVEHIFLVEPIWNSALEKQVIARAHRIGAKETVYVERLAMRDSIEESMLREGSTTSPGSGVSNQKKDEEAMRRTSVLMDLKTVTAGPPAAGLAEDAGPAPRGASSSNSSAKGGTLLGAGDNDADALVAGSSGIDSLNERKRSFTVDAGRCTSVDCVANDGDASAADPIRPDPLPERKRVRFG